MQQQRHRNRYLLDKQSTALAYLSVAIDVKIGLRVQHKLDQNVNKYIQPITTSLHLTDAAFLVRDQYRPVLSLAAEVAESTV
jgi:hypothetical protein